MEVNRLNNWNVEKFITANPLKKDYHAALLENAANTPLEIVGGLPHAKVDTDD